MKENEIEKQLELKEEKFDTPVIPKVVYQNLPSILKAGCDTFNVEREKDIFLTGALGLIGGSLPNYYGIYNDQRTAFNLYTMIVAPPASGKGSLLRAYKYVEKIQSSLLEKYNLELKEYKAIHNNKKEKSNDETIKLSDETPVPKFERLIIPANSSSAAFIQSLKSSNGNGILFETEADTLSQTFKQDWGNYSDVLRKAFNHEPISLSRKDTTTEIFIESPKISVVLSGTFNQVGSMGLDSPKNGLQSRFLFYVFESLPVFRKVSPRLNDMQRTSLDSLGNRMNNIYTILKRAELEFEMTDDQWQFFEKWFSKRTEKVARQYNNYVGALAFRLALSTYRIAGILSLLRTFERRIPGELIKCTWIDLKTALHLSDVYLSHGLAIFHFSKESEKDIILDKYLEFYRLLPNDKEFTRQDAVNISSSLFSDRTIDRRLEKLRKNGLLFSIKSGIYRKAVV